MLFSFLPVVGQRRFNHDRHDICRYRVCDREYHCAIAFVLQFRKQRLEGFDQGGLTVDVEPVGVCITTLGTHAQGCPHARLARQVCRLTPAGGLEHFTDV